MAKQDSNAGSPLLPSKILTNSPFSTELTQLEDQLNELVACQRFYNAAVYAMNEVDECEDKQPFQLGLFLTGQWIIEKGEKAMDMLASYQQYSRK